MYEDDEEEHEDGLMTSIESAYARAMAGGTIGWSRPRAESPREEDEDEYEKSLTAGSVEESEGSVYSSDFDFKKPSKAGSYAEPMSEKGGDTFTKLEKVASHAKSEKRYSYRDLKKSKGKKSGRVPDMPSLDAHSGRCCIIC